MCGICGFINHRDDALLREMASSIAHRGPDEEGFFFSGETSLGSRRLKVIDLETGSQPVYNEDGTVAVVFNGEIYNFRENRSFLEAKGHKFSTSTDTETLAHLYEEFGEGMFARLRGMFSFALWDSRKKIFILARDHFGIKPVFYSFCGKKLYFASEIKALLKVPEVEKGLDPEAIDSYFTHLYVPSPNTVYKRIKKLPPASYIVFKGGRFEIKKYWRLEKKEEIQEENRELLERIEYLMDGSVKEQMVSDVPLGLFLSGGLDSSSILYFLSKNSASRTKTFTISYEGDRDYDESEKAMLASNRFGTEHRNLPVKPDINELIGRLAASFDEPFADSSAVVNYLISREAKKYITVALTGIGGDEIFGGYPRYSGLLLHRFYSKAPLFFRKALSLASGRLHEGHGSSNNAGRVKRFLRGGILSAGEAYNSWISYIPASDKKEIYSPDFYLATRGHSGLNGRMDSPEDLLAFELANYMEGDLLYMGDMASMMNSLELRVPFLDLRLVELMNSVPLGIRMKNLRKKYLLKRIMKGKSPSELLKMPKKGFQVPISKWLTGKLREQALDLINSSDGEFINKKSAREMFEMHARGERNLSDQIYSLMIFELWKKSVVFKSGAAPGKLPEIGRPSPVAPWLRPAGKPAPEAPEGLFRMPSSPKTILIVSDYLFQNVAGGAAKTACELARALSSGGHRVIMLLRGTNSAPDTEISDGIRIYRYKSNIPNFLRLLGNLFGKEKIDVINFHDPYISFWVRLYMLFKSIKIPMVYTFQSLWSAEYLIRAVKKGHGFSRRILGGFLRKFMERFTVHYSDRVLVASSYMGLKLDRIHGSRSTIVPLGVDLKAFSPVAPGEKSKIKASQGINPAKTVFFTLRNLEPRMGLDNLLEAVKILKAGGKKELLFILGGKGSMEAELREKSEKLGVGDLVVFTGYIPDEKVRDYYRLSDAFILPTRELEGFGLVTLEAMACGIPVLATPVGANVEVAGGFDKSLLFRDSGAAAIAEGIRVFLERKDLAELGPKCREYAERNFSWDKYAGEMEKIFHELSYMRGPRR